MLKLGQEVNITVHEVADQIIRQWEAAPVKKDDEFNTIWAMAEREGAKRFKLELLNQLDKYDRA